MYKIYLVNLKNVHALKKNWRQVASSPFAPFNPALTRYKKNYLYYKITLL